MSVPPFARRRLARAILAVVFVSFLGSLVATAPDASAAAPVSTKETSLQRIQKMVARINAEASTPEGEEAVVTRLSRQLRAHPDTLRTQSREWGVGYGEVAMVYGFARSSRKSVRPATVYEMRRSGMEWEAIGRELGVKVDAVASRMKRNVGPTPAPASTSN